MLKLAQQIETTHPKRRVYEGPIAHDTTQEHGTTCGLHNAHGDSGDPMVWSISSRTAEDSVRMTMHYWLGRHLTKRQAPRQTKQINVASKACARPKPYTSSGCLLLH